MDQDVQEREAVGWVNRGGREGSGGWTCPKDLERLSSDGQTYRECDNTGCAASETSPESMASKEETTCGSP